MIIPPSEADDKRRLGASTEVVDVEVPHDDPPPTYEEYVDTTAVPIGDTPVGVSSSITTTTSGSIESSASNTSTSSTAASVSTIPTTIKRLLPDLKSSNYISISHLNDHIKGIWLLDPTFSPPRYLLPPLTPAEETGKMRRNLNLSTMNGYIEADVTITGLLDGHKDGDKKKINVMKDRKRALMYARSSNGAVKVKLHCSDELRVPFYLDIFASNGAVVIHLPRSFHGPLLIKTFNGVPKFSAEIQSRLTTFSDVNKTRRCFIGDYSGVEEEGLWEGDEVVVEARNGAVRFMYDDEEKERERGERKVGFFGKFFGF